MKIKAVAFDMDGTLYSSEPLIENVYKRSLQKLEKIFDKKYKYPTFSEIEPLIGQPVNNIYDTLFGYMGKDEIENFGKIVSDEFMTSISTYGGELFNNVVETLSHLKESGYLVLIASNGRRAYLNAIIKKFNLNVEPFVCVQEDKGIYEKADILKYYMDNYDLLSDEFIMVGDRTSDLEAARKAGCYFVGCNFGHGTSMEIKSADTVINEISNVIPVLKKLQGEQIA